MKIILILTLCLLFAFNAFAQEDENTQQPQTVVVEQIYLAKDNGEGKAGDLVEDFLTTDIPIYCIVELNSTKPAVVKMNLVAVKVAGVKPETRVITISYTTNGKQNRVNFKGKPDGTWTAGSYRIDIFIDGKLAAGQSFEIKKSPSEIQKATPQAEGFVAPKPKPRPKTAKQPRRN